MEIITDAAGLAHALSSSLDPAIKTLLAVRRDQLLCDTAGDYDLGDLVHFVVVEPGDSIADVEAAATYPLFTEPAFEWVEDHSFAIEAVVILSDDGFGIAVFVPDTEGVEPEIITILRDHAGRSIAAQN